MNYSLEGLQMKLHSKISNFEFRFWISFPCLINSVYLVGAS